MSENAQLIASAQRSQSLIVCFSCPQKAYLELRVPANATVIYEIEIEILSHDQGFSDYPDLHGTYDSNSFFNLLLLTPLGHEKVYPRTLQHNVHAEGKPRRHIISLKPTTEDDKLRKWIAAIRPCDVIQLMPLAEFPGWRNVVLEAEIRLYGIKADMLTINESERDLGDEQDSKSIYRPLGTKEIRVLQTLPANDSDSLRCRLEHVRLDDAERRGYCAISYCWGDLRDFVTAEVELSNRTGWGQVHLTRNLYDALVRLSKDSPSIQWLWTDAICINQRDNHERAQQVAIMKLIYENAAMVAVWLGPSTQHVVEFVGRAQAVQAQYEGMARTAAHDWKPQHLVGEEHYSKFGDDRFQRPLLDYPWFRRAWVLQEVYNAREVQVFCGELKISWSLVLRINHCYDRGGDNYVGPSVFRKDQIPAILSDLFVLDSPEVEHWQRRHIFRRNSKQRDILDIIVAGMDLEVTLPRDKIFALLSFASPDLLSSAPEYAAIQPDYNKTEAQVFRDFTRWWITTHSSLRILSAVHISVGRTWLDLNISSASPEFGDLRSSWSIWYDGNSRWARATLGLSPNCEYRAAGSTKPILSHFGASDEAFGYLSLDGVAIGEITDIKAFPFGALGAISDPVTDEPLPYGENPVVVGFSQSLSRVYNRIFDPFMKREAWSQGLPQIELYDPAQKHFDLAAEFGYLQEHRATHWDFAVQNGGGLECHGDCFFRTGNGNIGLCPTFARPGDLIVVLFGGNVPFILRRKSQIGVDHSGDCIYEFLGECYLDGFMDGQAMNEPVRRVQSFLLM